MLTLQNLVIAISLVLLAWYIGGTFLNRKRASVLIGAVRDSVKLLGEKPTIQWYGRSAFRVELGEPRAPVAALQVLCLLEPRDFAFAWIWGRLRRRRDQVQIAASYLRAPRSLEVEKPAIAGLTSFALKTEKPHLLLSLQVGSGMEASISEAVRMVKELGH